MTVLDERQLVGWSGVCSRPAPVPVRTRGHVRPYRPGPARPGIAPLTYRHTGAAWSRAPHARRPVSTTVTVALAGISALVTLWLGSLAQLSAGRQAASVVAPDQLAVVQVQAGETLQHLAGRVAPEASVEQIVSRIRELNNLDSAAVEAGQTLIAPVG